MAGSTVNIFLGYAAPEPAARFPGFARDECTQAAPPRGWIPGGASYDEPPPAQGPWGALPIRRGPALGAEEWGARAHEVWREPLCRLNDAGVSFRAKWGQDTPTKFIAPVAMDVEDSMGGGAARDPVPADVPAQVVYNPETCMGWAVPQVREREPARLFRRCGDNGGIRDDGRPCESTYVNGDNGRCPHHRYQ